MGKMSERDRMMLAELAKLYKKLTPAQELAMVLMAKAGDMKARDELYFSVLNFMIGKSINACNRWRNDTMPTELISDEFFLFCDTLELFDPSLGYRFLTFFGDKMGWFLVDEFKDFVQYSKRFIPESARARPDDEGEASSKEDRGWTGDEFELGFHQRGAEPEVPYDFGEITAKQLVSHFAPGTKYRQVIDALLGTAGHDAVTQAELSRRLKCSRENVSAMVKRIVAELRVRLGASGLGPFAQA